MPCTLARLQDFRSNFANVSSVDYAIDVYNYTFWIKFSLLELGSIGCARIRARLWRKLLSSTSSEAPPDRAAVRAAVRAARRPEQKEHVGDLSFVTRYGEVFAYEQNMNESVTALRMRFS